MCVYIYIYMLAHDPLFSQLIFHFQQIHSCENMYVFFSVCIYSICQLMLMCCGFCVFELLVPVSQATHCSTLIRKLHQGLHESLDFVPKCQLTVVRTRPVSTTSHLFSSFYTLVSTDRVDVKLQGPSCLSFQNSRGGGMAPNV